jgi:hypothetical protein
MKMKNLYQAVEDILDWLTSDDDVPVYPKFRELQESQIFAQVYIISSIEDSPAFWSEQAAIKWLLDQDAKKAWYQRIFQTEADKKTASLHIEQKEVLS